MIEGIRLFWIGQDIRSTLMVNFNKSLFDIYVWSAVLAHRAQFHKMAVGREFFYRIQNVECPNDIIYLCENGMLAINHGVRSRALFGKMYDCLRLNVSKDGGKRLVIHHIANA